MQTEICVSFEKQWYFNNASTFKWCTLSVKNILGYADSVYRLCIYHTCITHNLLLSYPTQELISHFDVQCTNSVRGINSSGLTLTVLCINCVSKISISTELTVPACCTWLTYQAGARQAVTAARDGEVKVVIALAWLTWSSAYRRLSKIAFCTPKAKHFIREYLGGINETHQGNASTFSHYLSPRICFPFKCSFPQMQGD